MRIISEEDRPPTAEEVAECIIVLAKEMSNRDPMTLRLNLLNKEGRSDDVESVINTFGLIVHLGRELEQALKRENRVDEVIKNN
jgi:hypothetical protein